MRFVVEESVKRRTLKFLKEELDIKYKEDKDDEVIDTVLAFLTIEAFKKAEKTVSAFDLFCLNDNAKSAFSRLKTYFTIDELKIIEDKEWRAEVIVGTIFPARLRDRKEGVFTALFANNLIVLKEKKIDKHLSNVRNIYSEEELDRRVSAFFEVLDEIDCELETKYLGNIDNIFGEITQNENKIVLSANLGHIVPNGDKYSLGIYVVKTYNLSFKKWEIEEKSIVYAQVTSSGDLNPAELDILKCKKEN